MKKIVILFSVLPYLAVCQIKVNYTGSYSDDKISGFELSIYQELYTITLYNPKYAIKPEKIPGSDMVLTGNMPNYRGKYQLKDDSLYLFGGDNKLVMKLYIIDSLSQKIVTNNTKAICTGDTIFRFSSFVFSENQVFLWTFSGYDEFMKGVDRDMNWFFYNKEGEVNIVPDTNCIHPYSKRFYNH